jgi:hypothetical protein
MFQGIAPQKKAVKHKVQFRDASNHQRILYMPQDAHENGTIIAKHPKDLRVYHLRLEDSFYTPRRWGRFWEAPYRRTWLVLEGHNGSVKILNKAKGDDGNPIAISDVQLNTLLRTKVIQEFLLADILSRFVQELRMMQYLIAGLIVLCILGIAYLAYQGNDVTKMLQALTGGP